MSEKGNKVLHLWAIRMNWLSWLARPIVALWNVIVSFFHYLWKIVIISWKSMICILNYRFWLLGGLGFSMALFIIFLSYRLSIAIKLPWLFFLGLIFSILPISWSFGEVADLIKKRDDTGEFNKIRESFWFSGSGFITAGIMFKYVVIASGFVVFQMLLSMVGLIPEAGGIIYGILLIPIIFLSVCALLCGLILSFGLAIFPGYVLFSYKDEKGGFFKNLKAELKTILEILRTKWFKILFCNIPTTILSILISIIPIFLLVSGIFLTYKFNSDMGHLSSSFKGMSVLITETLKNLQSSDLSFLSVFSNLISGISFSILAGLALGGAVAAFASTYFHIYRQNLPDSLYELPKFYKEESDSNSDLFMDIPGESNKSDGEVLSVDDLGDPDLVLSPGILSSSKNDLAVMDSNSDLSDQTITFDENRQMPKDEPVIIEKDEDDIISGDDILASLENTMDIEALPDSEMQAGVTNEEVISSESNAAMPEMDQSLNNNIQPDLNNEPVVIEKEEDDIISGDDILASLENTMDIEALPDSESQTGMTNEEVISSESNAAMPEMDQPLNNDIQPDLNNEPVVIEKEEDDIISGDDILASLENTMQIEGLPDDSVQSSPSVEEDITAGLSPDSLIPDDNEDLSGLTTNTETQNQENINNTSDDGLFGTVDNTMNLDEIPEASTAPVEPIADTNLSEENNLETGIENNPTESSDLVIDDDLLSNLDIPSVSEETVPEAQPVLDTAAQVGDGTYFSDKGQAGASSFLVSVKDNNQMYFGIKAPTPGSYNFILTLFFENGQSTTEFITLDSIDEKGMGYVKKDFSNFLTQDGYGKIQKVEVTPA